MRKNDFSRVIKFATKATALMFLGCGLTLSSCSDDDTKYDDEIKDLFEQTGSNKTAIDGILARLSNNEADIKKLKDLANENTVEWVKTIPGGFEVKFKESKEPIQIVNGKDGKNGADGKNGIDGKDGADGKNGIDGKDGADGKEGITPKIKDGIWWIGDIDTGIVAKGQDGKDGLNGKDGEKGIDGLSPRIKNGNWWIGEEDTGVPVTGPQGEKGESVIVTIDPITHHWLIDGEDTGVLAEGKDGKDGLNGKDGEKGDKGDQGEPGAPGKDGENLVVESLEINDEGYWVINGVETTVRAPKYSVVAIEDLDGQFGFTFTDEVTGVTQDITWFLNDIQKADAITSIEYIPEFVNEQGTAMIYGTRIVQQVEGKKDIQVLFGEYVNLSYNINPSNVSGDSFDVIGLKNKKATVVSTRSSDADVINEFVEEPHFENGILTLKLTTDVLTSSNEKEAQLYALLLRNKNANEEVVKNVMSSYVLASTKDIDIKTLQIINENSKSDFTFEDNAYQFEPNLVTKIDEESNRALNLDKTYTYTLDEESAKYFAVNEEGLLSMKSNKSIGKVANVTVAIKQINGKDLPKGVEIKEVFEITALSAHQYEIIDLGAKSIGVDKVEFVDEELLDKDALWEKLATIIGVEVKDLIDKDIKRSYYYINEEGEEKPVANVDLRFDTSTLTIVNPQSLEERQFLVKVQYTHGEATINFLTVKAELKKPILKFNKQENYWDGDRMFSKGGLTGDQWLLTQDVTEAFADKVYTLYDPISNEVVELSNANITYSLVETEENEDIKMGGNVISATLTDATQEFVGTTPIRFIAEVKIGEDVIQSKEFELLFLNILDTTTKEHVINNSTKDKKVNIASLITFTNNRSDKELTYEANGDYKIYFADDIAPENPEGGYVQLVEGDQDKNLTITKEGLIQFDHINAHLLKDEYIKYNVTYVTHSGLRMTTVVTIKIEAKDFQ